MKMPPQLLDLHFRMVKARGKAPNVETEWQTKNNYPVSEALANSLLSQGLNYGFTCPSGFACFIDADTKEVQDVLDLNKWTFRYSTGTPGHYQYAYFVEDGIGCVPLKDGAYIKGKGGFTVGPGSIHPNGNIYGKDVRYAPIAVVRNADLMKWLAPYLLKKESAVNHTATLSPKNATESMVMKVRDELLEVWIKADGQRHALTLAIVGYLERKGWIESDIASVISSLIELSKKGYEHLPQVHYAFGRGERKWGLPMILAIEEGIAHGH